MGCARSFRTDVVWVDLAETSRFCPMLDDIPLIVRAAVARRARPKIILRKSEASVRRGESCRAVDRLIRSKIRES